jgi:hypothetical protein
MQWLTGLRAGFLWLKLTGFLEFRALRQMQCDAVQARVVICVRLKFKHIERLDQAK